MAKTRRRFKATTNSKHCLPVAENLLEQRFTADGPNKVWTSDITYVWTEEGWLYLAVVLDLFSRQIVGWAMGDRIDTALVLRAFRGGQGPYRSLNGRLYEAPVHLMGGMITLLFHEEDPARVEAFHDGASQGMLAPLDVRVNCRVRRKHKVVELLPL